MLVFIQPTTVDNEPKNIDRFSEMYINTILKEKYLTGLNTAPNQLSSKATKIILYLPSKSVLFQ